MTSYSGPERRASRPKPNLLAERLADLAPVRALVVDSGADGEAMVERLQAEKLNVTLVPAADEALRLIAGGEFDVVLLEVELPSGNGIDLLRRIREHHSPVALPVVIVTKRMRSEDVVEAL